MMRFLTAPPRAATVEKAAVVGLTVLAILAVSSPALAWQRYYATVDGLALRSGPGTGYSLLQRVNRGTPLDAECASTGTNVNGNAVWLRLTGKQWVSDYYTTSDGWGTRYPTGLPDCGTATTVGEQAARAAEARLGQVYTSENPNAGWWSGWCETFVEVAYGRRFRYSSAIQHYYARRDAGQIRGGIPPRGAIVFWGGGYGHTGVAVGGGQVISTMGYSYQRYPVSRNSYTYFTNYLGWALPYG
jgi:uncharacterized protein YraI